MALSGPGLAALVFADHLSTFPTAATSIRSNALTGVIPHNPSEEFINALCEGFAVAALQMTIADQGTGTAPPGGVAPPTIVAFPGASAAKAELIATLAWIGEAAALAAFVFVESVLLNTAKISQLVMNPNPFVGTGTGVVSSASNPSLKAAMQSALGTSLSAAFTASGFFGTGDVPGTPVNPDLALTLPAYASALATGFASMTAQVPYASPSPPGAAAGGINIGKLL